MTGKSGGDAVSSGRAGDDGNGITSSDSSCELGADASYA